MFTGIIQGVGKVLGLKDGVLTIEAPDGFAVGGTEVGESIAVNGCCLTVINEGGALRFDLSPETLKRSSLGRLETGSLVNLERAMSASGRFGGHIVQGHVDATGTVLAITPVDNSVVYRFQAPAEYDRYLIDKGSISIDGISLTVVNPTAGAFEVWIIPHTIQETNLGSRQIGDIVNLEFDVIARYVEKMMSAQLA